MKILDRYIANNYISKLLWSVAAATIVFLVLDMVQMLDKFIDANVPTSLVFRYYYLYLPYIVYLILPVATLLATLFTIGGLTMTNELTAMHVSGVPFYRPLGWLLFVATIVAAAGFMIGESVVPAYSRERMDILRYELKNIPRASRVNQGQLFMQIGRNKQLSIDRYNSETREAFGLKMVEVEGGRIVRRTDAEKMIWRDGQWHMQGAVIREFMSDGQVVWKRGAGASAISPIKLKPDQMEKVQTKPEEMNYVELREYIRKQKSIGGNVTKWEVDLRFKVSLPIAAVVIVLFGAPVASVRRRGGTMLGFGMALFICFIYYGFLQIGKILGYKGILEPSVSAWVGNLFFGLLGLGILYRWSR